MRSLSDRCGVRDGVCELRRKEVSRKKEKRRPRVGNSAYRDAITSSTELRRLMHHFGTFPGVYSDSGDLAPQCFFLQKHSLTHRLMLPGDKSF